MTSMSYQLRKEGDTTTRLAMRNKMNTVPCVPLGDELDRQVRVYLSAMRGRGCALNTAIAIGVGIGIARKSGSFIIRSSEDFTLTKDWAKSLLHRMGLVKRRASTKAKVYRKGIILMFCAYVQSTFNFWMP